MKKAISVGLCLGLVTVIAACSSKPARQIEQNIERAPDWYVNPPEDNDEFLYAVSSSVSTRREVARQKAETNARTNMAQKLEVKVESLEKIFTEEVTSGDDANYSEAFTRASKSITGTTLRGITADQIEFTATPEGRYECFVLVRLPVGDARRSLDNALSQEEELYVKFKESKAFQELQEDLNRIGKDN